MNPVVGGTPAHEHSSSYISGRYTNFTPVKGGAGTGDPSNLSAVGGPWAGSEPHEVSTDPRPDNGVSGLPGGHSQTPTKFPS